MSGGYQELLRQALEKMEAHKKELEEVLAHVHHAIAATESALERVNRTVRAVREISPTEFTEQSLLKLLSSFRALDEALVFLAEHNDGYLNSYDARPLLVDAGFLKGSPSTVSTRLHEALEKSERFESLNRRGRWSLVDPKTIVRAPPPPPPPRPPRPRPPPRPPRPPRLRKPHPQ